MVGHVLQVVAVGHRVDPSLRVAAAAVDRLDPSLRAAAVAVDRLDPSLRVAAVAVDRLYPSLWAAAVHQAALLKEGPEAMLLVHQLMMPSGLAEVQI